MEAVHVAVVADIRQKHKAGTYPIRVRITYRRARRYYQIGTLRLTLEDFERARHAAPRGVARENKLRMERAEGKARRIVEGLGDGFSFDAFALAWLGPPHAAPTLEGLLRDTVARLEGEDRIGTARSYRTALAAWVRYRKKETPLDAVTPELLKAFEAHLMGEGSGPTTVGIYQRAVRVAVNDAIDRGLMPRESYPYGKRRYTIPAAEGRKIALSAEDFAKLMAHAPEDLATARWLDLWRLLVLLGGINLRDVCGLRYGDLDADVVRFVRAKTARANRTRQTAVRVPLLAEARATVKRWGTYANPANAPKEARIFDLVPAGLPAAQEDAAVRQAGKNMNRYLRKVAAALGLGVVPTTYTARHTAATLMQRSGTPLEVIADLLGHRNPKTTAAYLAGFEDSARRAALEGLTRPAPEKKLSTFSPENDGQSPPEPHV